MIGPGYTDRFGGKYGHTHLDGQRIGEGDTQ